jgi:hypothetical protein
MAEESAPVTQSVPTPAAPSTPDEFRAAAAKALTEGPPKADAPTTEQAPVKDVKAEVADAEKKLAEDMAAKKAEEAKGDEPKAPKGWERPFETLAREKAELRAKEKALREQASLLEEARALKQAKEAGDPLAVLKANGWEWDDVVNHLTGQKRDPSKAPAPKANDELAALRAEVMAMKAEKQQASIQEQIQKTISGSSFKLVKELVTPAAVYQELDVYFRQTGELPVPGDLQASIELAVEAAEKNLSSEAERWKKALGLTGSVNSPTVNGAAKGDVPRAGESVVSGTLSNSLDGAPRATTQAATPKTPEEFREAALRALVEGPKR